MNKTVTFNLNGLVFTIEEDGYEALSLYLDAVQHYLDKLEEGREILVEVEARIGEKFKQMLQVDSRMVLNLADIEQMKAEMGSPEQFQDVDMEDVAEEADQDNPLESTPAVKSLFRTKQNRIFGGVANGLAQHLCVGVVSIRLLFILSVFLFAGYGFIIYLILWVALPARDQMLLTEKAGTAPDDRAQRLYRNPEGKVIGGVAGGLAAYLRIDPIILRVLFIIALFWGGFGLVAYIILWVATPAAQTLAQKVEMEGEQPNLANLSKAGRRKPPADEPTESLAARLVQLPFVLAMAVLKALGKILQSLVGVFRIVFGFMILFVAAVFLFGYVATMAAIFGVYFGGIPADLQFPIHQLTGTTGSDVSILVFSALFLLLPILFGLYLGIRLFFNRKIFTRRTLTLGAMGWVVLILALLLLGIRTATYFQHDGKFVQQYEVSMSADKPLFIDRNDEEKDAFMSAQLRILPGHKAEIELREVISAKGKDPEEAEIWASMAVYGFNQPSDSSLFLNRSLKIKPGARFRGQQGRFELLVPPGQPIRLTKQAVNMLDNYRFRHELLRHRQNTYFITVHAEGLVCLNCVDEAEATEKQHL